MAAGLGRDSPPLVLKPPVVIPARNAAETLPALLAALAGQTLPVGEVVVAEDGSTDATVEVARSHGARVVEVPPPGGPGIARNAGVAATTGDPILFLDADTLPPPDWAERIIRRLEAEGPSTVAVWCGYSGPTEDSPLARLQHHDIAFHQAPTPRYVEVITTANLVVRRGAFEAAGGFPPMRVDEDYVFGARLARVGRIRWDPEIRVGHRFRSSWRAYLRQQRAWARGIPEMYARAPRLLFVPQSFRRRRVALELGLLLATPVALAVHPLAALLPAAGWDLCGAAFRRHLASAGCRGLPVRRFLLLRDLAWLVGLAEGLALLPRALQ